MRDRIDPESPVPLYHQLAEAVRYRIATGELPPGRRLPSLRRAASAWDVNLHTVRRAYGKLAEQGIVEVRPRSGTMVLDSGAARAVEATEQESFLRDVLRRARERWGLTPSELTDALGELAAPMVEPGGVVHVVECSEAQATDLANQLAACWRVRAEPWSLEWAGEPGDGLVLCTFFHYGDVKRRWPERFPAVRFVAIEPDPGLQDRLDGLLDGHDEPVEVVLCERTEAMARNIAADLRKQLPSDRYRLRIECGEPEAVLAREEGPVLLPPRVWGGLTEADRAGAVEVRYVFELASLERLGSSLKWEAR